MQIMPLAQLNLGSAPGTRPSVEPAVVAPVATGAAGGGAGAGATAVSATAGAATSATSASQPAADKVPPPTSSPWMTFVPIILMFVVLYFVLFRGQRKEEKRRKQLIAELKKGDKVMTIGGMVARVVSIDGDEVVLKVDESANVKAVYRKSAIQEVLGDDKGK